MWFSLNIISNTKDIYLEFRIRPVNDQKQIVKILEPIADNTLKRAFKTVCYNVTFKPEK